MAISSSMLACRQETAENLSRPATQSAPPAVREIWEAFYLQNAKVGHSQTTIHPAELAGNSPRENPRLVQIDSESRLALVRFGQRTEQALKTTTVETTDGVVIRFETEVSFGPTPLKTSGRVDGSEMVIETLTKGSKQTARIPWTSDIRGFHAVEQSLEESPLKPGETRRLKMLMPVLNQVADVQLTAGDNESTNVLGIRTKLSRIEIVARLPNGGEIASTIWIDRDGQTIKTHMEAMQQESFRTTREIALSEQPAGPEFDLGADALVRLDKPLLDAHNTRQVRYLVELVSNEPAKVFASGGTQSLSPTGLHSGELTVRSVRPGDLPKTTQSPEPTVAKEYLSANSVLQIDDPRIQAMAREAKGTASTPVEVAVALERYVHGAIAKKNFTQAFATASEVAESREGDCTEHAVLLAALARACEIPSRVAIGLVYVESSAGFGFHMWTELFLQGQWVPFDATLGRGGIGAAHIKLTDSSLDGAAAYSTFLPVAQVVGQLKIRVLEAQ